MSHLIRLPSWMKVTTSCVLYFFYHLWILLSLSCLFCLPFCCILSSSPSLSHPPIFVPHHFLLFIHLVNLDLAFPLFSADASLSLSAKFSFWPSHCPLICPSLVVTFIPAANFVSIILLVSNLHPFAFFRCRFFFLFLFFSVASLGIFGSYRQWH